MKPFEGQAAAFRALHQPGRPLLLPNAWDAGTARLIEADGAAAIATTSAGVAWTHGYQDGDALPVAILIEAVREISRAVSVPLSVDIEGGYLAEPWAIAELVATLADLGVAGINIEDGADSPDALCAKLEAIRAACSARQLDLFINARTDVFLRGLVSADRALAETVDRGRRYRETGADGLFVPGVSDEDTIRGIVDGIGAPLNVMVVPNLPSVAELAALGVSRVSAGAAMIKATYELVRQMTRQLLADGVYDDMFGASVDYGETNALFARS